MALYDLVIEQSIAELDIRNQIQRRRQQHILALYRH